MNGSARCAVSAQEPRTDIVKKNSTAASAGMTVNLFDTSSSHGSILNSLLLKILQVFHLILGFFIRIPSTSYIFPGHVVTLSVLPALPFSPPL